MAVFVYSGLAVASTGKKVKRRPRCGQSEGPSRAAEARRRPAHRPRRKRPRRGSTSRAARSTSARSSIACRRVSDVAMLTRQLATLVRRRHSRSSSRSPRSSSRSRSEELQKRVLALRSVTGSTKEPRSRSRSSRSQHRSSRRSVHRTWSPPARSSGTLETVLERLSDFMEKQAQLREQGHGAALAYPMLMLLVGAGPHDDAS